MRTTNPTEGGTDDPGMVLPEGRHFVSSLGGISYLASEDRCILQAALTPAVRGRAGEASIGVLASLADTATSTPALVACRPDWTATQDLSVHAGAPFRSGPIVMDCRLVRAGSKVVVTVADIYDGAGEHGFDALTDAIDADAAGGTTDLVRTGRSLVTFARLPGSAAVGVDDYDPASWIGETRGEPGPTDVPGTIHDWLGMRAVDAEATVFELELRPHVANSIGTINGGAQSVLVEAAAAAAFPGMAVVDMQLRFLAQVKVGPARTRCRILRDDGDHAVVTVDLIDVGADHRLLTMATLTLHRPRD